MTSRFRGVPVRSVMDGNVVTITPDTSIDNMVRDLFLRQGRRAAPVVVDGQVVGIATLSDVKEVASDAWAITPVKDIMTQTPLHTVTTADDLNAALALLAKHGLNQLIVLEEGRLVGMVGRADIIRYLQFTEQFGVRPLEQ